MAMVIRANGEEESVNPDEGGEFSLKELQGYVSGYIELVHLISGKILVVDEDGLSKGLKPNMRASVLARQPIVGDCILINGNQIS
jgi:hypothetical protein|tara:strand:+ start:11227 stop:11481 length:255 start_codon:yes stop_codon:yes gene_type:complete